MSKSLHHSFDIHLAEKYGIEEAILIHHFQHWINVNIRLGRNFHDGRTWMYQTLSEIAAHFPYWSESQVYEIIERLCRGKNRRSKKKELDYEPVLMKGNFNKVNYDKTIWYAFINQEKFTVLANANTDVGKCQNRVWQMPKPIPDTKTDTKPDIKKDNVGDAALFAKSKEEKIASTKKKFTKPQVLLLNKLMAYNPEWGDPLKEGDICFWINNWTVQRIEEVLELYKQRVSEYRARGAQIHSMGAMMRHALNMDEKPRDDNFEKNLSFATERGKSETCVEITKNYVKFVAGNYIKELYFNINNKLFENHFEELIENCKVYI